MLVIVTTALSDGKFSDDVSEIHWTITGPRSVTLAWRGPGADIRYGKQIPYDHVQTSKNPKLEPISSPGPFQEVVLNNLIPNTVYHYSIGIGSDHSFRTPPLPGTSAFTVTAEGDIGSSLHYPGVVPVQKLVASRHPEFVLVLGDLTYGRPDGQPSVDQHFDDVMVWSQDSAYMPVWGNHEWGGPGDDLRNYKGRFEFPHPQTSTGAPHQGCCGKDWYWFDYGNVRFIAYPEPYNASTWLQWDREAGRLMDQADSDSNLTFIVTFGHRPPFSSGHHQGSSQLREILDHLAYRHPKYVLNLSGHSHNYERTYPIHGLTNITVGTGGSMLEESKTTCLFQECPAPSWSAFRAMHFGVLELQFNSDAIRGTFICGPPGGGENDIDCELGGIGDRFLIAKDAHRE